MMTIVWAITSHVAEMPAWLWIVTLVGIATTMLLWVVLEE